MNTFTTDNCTQTRSSRRAAGEIFDLLLPPVEDNRRAERRRRRRQLVTASFVWLAKPFKRQNHTKTDKIYTNSTY